LLNRQGRPVVSCRGGTSNGSFRLRAWLRRSVTSTAAGSAIKGAEDDPRGQRVLDGSSGVGAAGCDVFAASNKVSAGMGVPTKIKTRPLSMQPPRLAAIAHGKLSSHVCPKSAPPERKTVQPSGQFVQPVQTTTRPGLAFAAPVGVVSLLVRS
jgi:hypothetical protein